MKFMIDGGHGPNTPGKRVPDGSMKEFQFNSAVAKYVADRLKDYENVQTQFAHDSKTDVSLKARTDKANKWGADVYVSIHANALYSDGRWHTGGGIETFVYTTKPKTALALAQKVQAALIKETGLRNRGVKYANFHVLRESKMTAILIECGFMDNKEEAALLKSDDYRKKCAKAIVDGLVAQYKLKKKAAPKKAAAPKKEAGTFYRVVTGSFSDKRNADSRVAELKKAGFDSFIDTYKK